MQDLISAVATSPFLWMAVGFWLVLLALTHVRPGGVRVPAPTDKRWLNAVIYFAIIFAPVLALIFLAVLTLLTLIVWQIMFGEAIKDNPGDLRWYVLSLVGLLTALAGIIGTPLALIRVFTTERQTAAQETGLTTDRINTAVAGLGAEKIVRKMLDTPQYQKDGADWKRDAKGNLVAALRPDGQPLIRRESLEYSEPNIEVRIGAIYALERLAGEEPSFHIQIIETLCAYVRHNAPCNDLTPREPPLKFAKPRDDVRTAVTVIGRRSAAQIDLEWNEKFRLDFRRCDLSGVDFARGDFSAAQFHRCRLEGADFSFCKLHGTMFFASLLNYARFMRAELVGTRFDQAVINRPEPAAGSTSDSINFGNINGISVAAADLTAIDYLGEAEKRNKTFGTRDTRLNFDLEEDREGLRQKQLNFRQAEESGDADLVAETQLSLRETGFMYWCPYDMNDLDFNHMHTEFLVAMGLSGFPYE